MANPLQTSVGVDSLEPMVLKGTDSTGQESSMSARTVPAQGFQRMLRWPLHLPPSDLPLQQDY